MARALNPWMLEAANGRAEIRKVDVWATGDDLPTVVAFWEVVLVQLNALVRNAYRRALDHSIEEVQMPEIALLPKCFPECVVGGVVRACTNASKVVGSKNLPNMPAAKLQEYLPKHIDE